MRLQHAKQAASGLSTDTPGRMQAKAVIVPEVERLHWRIWNGKAKNARRTLERVRKVMHVFQGERGHRTMAVPSPTSCGTRCAKSTTISAAKASGSSITPNDTEPACALGHR
jgi:ornithine cyclodeaminase/alanine dehydrogenase-like protein (mu-crystallin family)